MVKFKTFGLTPVASNGGSDTNPATGKPDLTAALNGWLESSKKIKVVMNELLAKNADTGKN